MSTNRLHISTRTCVSSEVAQGQQRYEGKAPNRENGYGATVFVANFNLTFPGALSSIASSRTSSAVTVETAATAA
eukprot:1588118-Pleurochrysis_carterae.AAC.1